MKNFTVSLLILLLVLYVVLFISAEESNSAITLNREDVTVPKNLKLTNDKKHCEEICKELNIDLGINNLDKAIKKNKTAIEIIKSECLWASSKSFDVTGDGKAELVLNSGGAGCGSCHYRTIHILEGENIVFRIEGDDFSIQKPSLPIAGFKLLKPLRRFDEGLCCPTEYIAETYEYSPPDKPVDFGKQYFQIVAKGSKVEPDELESYPFIFYDSRVEIRKEQVATK